jgi:hypothetical protein
MVSGRDFGEFVFSNYFAVPVFVVAYLIAPLLERYVKFK